MRGDGRDRRVGVAVGEGMVDADVVRGEVVEGGITIMEEVVVLDEGEDEGAGGVVEDRSVYSSHRSQEESLYSSRSWHPTH